MCGDTTTIEVAVCNVRSLISASQVGIQIHTIAGGTRSESQKTQIRVLLSENPPPPPLIEIAFPLGTPFILLTS